MVCRRRVSWRETRGRVSYPSAPKTPFYGEEQAVRAQLALARQEGIAAGMSSGAALAAALALAARPEAAGKRIVGVLPDGGERYAASPAFTDLVRTIEGP